MSSCVFCKIIKGEIPSKIIFESDELLAFNDLHPQAKTHVLFIPKVHVESLFHVEDFNLIKNLFETMTVFASKHNLEGFRSVINTGEKGGQSVFHLHAHLLAGSKISGHFA